MHAVVARSTFPSQNAQNTPAPDHFWQLRCRKSARRCGAKHISKSKCTRHIRFGHFWKFRCRKNARRCGAKHISKSKCAKHTRFGPLLEVQMSKKCTPLWREAHFQVKMCKAHQVRTTFGSSDVEKVHAVVARSTFPSQHVQKHHMFAPLLQVQMSKKCTPLWREAHFPSQNVKKKGVRTTFGGSDVASLRFTTLHYPTLHSTTLHYTTLHFTTLPSTTLHYVTLHYAPLHYK